MYDDEDHWLIVYTDNSKSMTEENGYLDWYFEGMQGDNTDKYLPADITSKFNDNLYNSLKIHDGNIGQSFHESFEVLAKEARSFSIDRKRLLMTFPVNAFVLVHMYLMVFYNNNKQYRSYTLCDNDEE
jgi:hypothetical protein